MLASVTEQLPRAARGSREQKCLINLHTTRAAQRPGLVVGYIGTRHRTGPSEGVREQCASKPRLGGSCVIVVPAIARWPFPTFGRTARAAGRNADQDLTRTSEA